MLCKVTKAADSANFLVSNLCDMIKSSKESHQPQVDVFIADISIDLLQPAVEIEQRLRRLLAVLDSPSST